MASKISAVDVLKSLNIEELTTRRGELEKELHATNVLLKAATIAVHGKPEKKPRVAGKKKGGGAPPVVSADEVSGAPKVRIIKFLRKVGAARIAQIGEATSLSDADVADIVNNDAAFETRGAGHWRLRGD